MDTPQQPRLRDLGIAIGKYPAGKFNAITDVAGVRVGHETVVTGAGDLRVGHGPVRTGVTVIEPRPGRVYKNPAFAGAFSMNGSGELVGLEWVRESGLLTTPIAITNSNSLGTVRDALVAHEMRDTELGHRWALPVVGETYDGILNDINGQHLRAEHVEAALASAASGPVAEGNVGGGTGMICHGFKGGVGTSSRVVEIAGQSWTVGVLVQANYGRREDLVVDGKAVGRVITEHEVPVPVDPIFQRSRGDGSIIVVVATDAPLLPDQCRRLALRSSLGIARVGGGMSNASGDLIIAFATGNDGIPAEVATPSPAATFAVRAVPHQLLDPLLTAAVESTEEAIVNALLAAETMVGRDGITAYGLSPERLLSAMDKV